MNIYARLPMPNNPGVTATFTSTEAQIATTIKRRWWQLWLPRRRVKILASTPHAIRKNDHVQLVTVGPAAWAVIVNGEPLLYYPPLPPKEADD